MTQIVHARIRHARRGGARNDFTYSADFVLVPMHAPATETRLYKRNGAGVFAVLDRDHGRGQGDPSQWAREFIAFNPSQIWLLTQPRLFGFVFNPISFWFFMDGASALRAVLAEVNNTDGDRHAYLCAREDGATIGPGDIVTARKAMWVSPFQRPEGNYTFRFTWRDDRVGALINYRDDGGGGMAASIEGRRTLLTDRALVTTALRRPFGSFGVLALIFWQALKLTLKGERYGPNSAARYERKLG